MKKHIILCLDRTPTMKTVQEQTRESLRTFAGELKRFSAEGSDTFCVTEIQFASKTVMNRAALASEYKPSDCTALERGGIRAAEVLLKAKQKIESDAGAGYDGSYILFITDNSLEPTESLEGLHEIISSLDNGGVRGFAAGFLADGFEAGDLQNLTALLSFFPGGKSRILKDKKESRKQMEAIVAAIARDDCAPDRRPKLPNDENESQIPVPVPV